MTVKKCRERLIWIIMGGALLFVVVGLGIEMISKYKTTNTMVVILEDSTRADVLVILSEAYSEKKWAKVFNVIKTEADLSHDIEFLNGHITEMLQAHGHPVVAFSIDRQKNVIYKGKGSKSP